MSKIADARSAYNDAVVRMTEIADEIEALDENATDEQLGELEQKFQDEKTEVERCRGNMEKFESIAEARAKNPVVEVPAPDEKEEAEQRNFVTAKGETKAEATYRPDGGASFFRDIVYAKQDPAAAERLQTHQAEQRDLTTTATAGGGFVPPVYLGELYAALPRAARPFADIVPKRPLPPSGMSITIPRITTGTSVAVMTSENASVNEVDIVEATITVPVRTIAGQQDVSQQLLDRTDPSIDSIIFSDLRNAYDASLDSQAILGTGNTGQLLGVRAVTSVNTVAYTDGTPTAAELVPKIYDAIQKIETNRFQPADTIVMHPRRAAWLASNLSSTFPLFQLGTLTQAAGTQDEGMLRSFSGLRVVLDASIGTTYGASTNEDEIYVIRVADLILMEGPLTARVLTEVLSGTLTVRIQLFGYAAFASARFPSSITIISGTGLVAPTF